ncbi:MAG: hypothetical protein WCF85_19580 [Rhodospirillaceae bacterium]
MDNCSHSGVQDLAHPLFAPDADELDPAEITLSVFQFPSYVLLEALAPGRFRVRFSDGKPRGVLDSSTEDFYLHSTSVSCPNRSLACFHGRKCGKCGWFFEDYNVYSRAVEQLGIEQVRLTFRQLAHSHSGIFRHCNFQISEELHSFRSRAESAATIALLLGAFHEAVIAFDRACFGPKTTTGER